MTPDTAGAPLALIPRRLPLPSHAISASLQRMHYLPFSPRHRDATPAPGTFDAAFDRGSLVAIDPELRERYAAALAPLVRPGGRILLVTVFHDPFKDGRSAAPPTRLRRAPAMHIRRSRAVDSPAVSFPRRAAPRCAPDAAGACPAGSGRPSAWTTRTCGGSSAGRLTSRCCRKKMRCSARRAGAPTSRSGRGLTPAFTILFGLAVWPAHNDSGGAAGLSG